MAFECKSTIFGLGVLVLIHSQSTHALDGVPVQISPTETTNTNPPATPATPATEDTPVSTEETKDSDTSATQSAVNNNAISNKFDNIKKYLVDKDFVDGELFDYSMEFVNYLLKSTRADQDAVYSFARTINRNLDKLDSLTGCTDCDDLVLRIRSLNKQLIDDSYSDDLLQNSNLSNQLKTRLANLVADSLLLPINEDIRSDFVYEYELISERYLKSRRFRFGIGVSNAYMPSLSYNGSSSIDFSTFQNNINGGSDRLAYSTEFSNEVSTTLLLSADTPYLKLDATFPNVVNNESTVLGVRSRDIDATDRNLLYRSTVTSSLEIDYDISAQLKLNQVARYLPNFFGLSGLLEQSFWGIGGGITGIQVTDTISNDFRFPTEDTAVYADLESSDIQSTTDNKSYILPFISLSYGFEISDEFHAGIDYRKYVNSNISDRINVDDEVITLQAVWYPTFHW